MVLKGAVSRRTLLDWRVTRAALFVDRLHRHQIGVPVSGIANA
jgi:hypothetical protein